MHRRLSDSNIQAEIPDWIGDFAELEELSVVLLTFRIFSKCGFFRIVPKSMAKLTKLLDLDLRGNKLTGSFPPALKNLTNLRNL